MFSHNIYRYLKEYGDKSFKESHFNIIDALILTDIAYFPVGDALGYVFNDTPLYHGLEQFLKFKDVLGAKCITKKHDIKLSNIIIKKKRFENVTILNHVNKIDKFEESQFSVITYRLNEKEIFVSFRGTDTTFIGWKEDLNLAFENIVPGQIKAYKYLDYIADLYPNYKIYVSGHSKGGNLAIYGATYCKAATQKRIKLIFDFDGPGFTEEMLKSKEYTNIRYKIISVMPSSSVVGLIFDHSDRYGIIKSSKVGLLSHDLYSWKIKENDFVYTQNMNRSALINREMIQNLLKSLNQQEREEFIDTLYRLLLKTKVKTTKSWVKHLSRNFYYLVQGFSSLSQEQKEILTSTFKSMFGFYLTASRKRQPKGAYPSINKIID